MAIRILLLLSIGLWGVASLYAQDSTKVQSKRQDSTVARTNQEAIFNRPFVLQGSSGRNTAAIGGYLEGNTNYFVTDGVEDGFSMELRRFNIFIYSTIGQRIKFLSELEFEHGTEEIALETALIDFQVHPYFVFRAGIVLPPVGYFNQNHDSPKWEFIDRPLVSTTLIPATLSEVGFGIYGRIPRTKYVFTYEGYLVNGLQDGVISNLENRTSLQMGKSPTRFGEDNNGVPALTGRVAVRKRKLGELGLSYYGGIYNTFKVDGLAVDSKRSLRLFALDYSFSLSRLQVIGEAAFLNVNVPVTVGQQFGSRQWGFHTDLVYPVWKTNLLGWKNVVFNAIVRLEKTDYNQGSFRETGDRIGDDITAIVPGVSLRFSASTVLRANYRYHWQRDLLSNPLSKRAGFQVGFASYF